MKKLASLNINLDSIRECLKLSGSDSDMINDPAFFGIADRFFKIAAEFKAKYTIFVIGKDLLNKEHFAKVREWSRLGHEIGNHTFNHFQNFAELDNDSMYEEIKKAHDIINECIGHGPKGFISPAWSYSPHQTTILSELGYEYDASLFPSYLMPLIQLELKIRSKMENKSIPIFRKDLHGSLFGSRQPYFASEESPWKERRKGGSLFMLPLPMTKLRVPVWHSMSFVNSPLRYRKMLESAINNSRAFYYLIHPADLACPESDLLNMAPSIKTIKRMAVPIEKKIDLMKNAFEIISQRCSFITMSELASIQKGIICGTKSK